MDVASLVMIRHTTNLYKFVGTKLVVNKCYSYACTCNITYSPTELVITTDKMLCLLYCIIMLLRHLTK